MDTHRKPNGYQTPCCPMQQGENAFRRCVFCSTRHGNASELANLPNLTDLVGTADAHGRSPLHWAVSKGHASVAKLLLMHGAAVDARDNYGETPLTLAGRWSKTKPQTAVLDIMAMLLRLGAQLNVQQSEGHTALHVSVGAGYDEAVTLLLNAGADSSIENMFGEAAAVIALRRLVDNDATVARWKNVAMARQLLQHGVLVSQTKRLYVLLNSALSAAANAPAADNSAHDVVTLLNEHGYILTEQERTRQRLRPLSSAQKRDNVAPLAVLCRHAVRRCLERTIPTKSKSLPVPAMVRRYIVTGCHA